MIRPVAERRSLEEYSAIPSIARFGELISQAAGHSSLREIVLTDIHPGGCAVNLGDGLAALGVPVDCFATLGTPPHRAFATTTARFRSTHSWGREPGRTLAFEFVDGKLMFTSVTQLAEFNAHDVAARLSSGAYQNACSAASVIALTDWTLYPHMTSVWQLLQTEVFAHLPHRPAFFFDLVDPSSRSETDVRAMLQILQDFEPFGPVTLGLNGNEANILARLLDLPDCNDSLEKSLELAGLLRAKLGLSEVVIHHIRSAAVAASDGNFALPGPFCSAPKKSTGAGDRFNAGFLVHLLGLSPEDRLLCATATSGFFVREARSASLPELEEFLQSSAWPST
jgi:sugar/nucleoside kinase (ribokinase family)